MISGPWGYCSGCQTFVLKIWKTSLLRNTPSGWHLAPHNWDGRQNTRTTPCGRTTPYSPQRATAQRVRWQRAMDARDREFTEMAINSNKLAETKSTTGSVKVT